MPTFTISIVNETFSASHDQEGSTIDVATAQALKAALQIGAEEVAGGKSFFAAEVKVGTLDETIKRFVVSVGASPLQTTE